ncbi:MAG: hypothetical protein ACYTG1_04805 [Planctomycetota bacterium]|jgi:hypothetical protein
MSQSRAAAEKVRPILRAMEQSIDAARRRRVDRTETPSSAAVPGRMADASRPTPFPLKARPKRPTTFVPRP